MDATWTIGGDDAWRVVAADAGRLRTLALGRPGADDVALRDVRELAVVCDASRWRGDLPGWRWLGDAGADGVERGLASPDHDDSGWVQTSHLHPYYHVQVHGTSWFRARVELPAGERGQPLHVVLGSIDDEDWSRYRLFVDGAEVADWQPPKAWHEPEQVRIDPDHPAYPADAFGGTVTIAVEATEIDRRQPWMYEGEEEHYFFQGWLVDQFVATGDDVYRRVDDFELVAAPDPATERLDEAGFDLRSPSSGLTAAVRYAAGAEGTVRKEVVLTNGGDAGVAVLDVVLDDLSLDGETSRGGRGLPILLGGWWTGLEHPAGVTMGGGGRVRLVQMPGVDVAPGASLACRAVVSGAVRAGETPEAAFRRYLWAQRPRRERMLTVYSALGWYDFTNPADPLFELDRELVEENLAQLDELPVPIDVYMFDDVWEWTDPTSFRKRTFPAGAADARQAVEAHGMRAGLWMSPTSTHWGWGGTEGMEASIVGGVSRTLDLEGGGTGILPGALDPETGAWSWDVVFGFGQTCGPRMCPASEPLRSAIPAGMRAQVGDLQAAVLKIDGAQPHCTAVDHGHRPGRYSVEPICDALMAGIAAAREASPDLFVIWYWGLRSPWWLLHGDVIFDKGIKLEAASPASIPVYGLRQAISLNTDQAVRHERLVPLSLMDSLGTWLGNVSWANRIGTEWWREALLLDLARGSSIFQVWGDVSLLDDDDRTFLGDVLRFAADQGDAFHGVREVGGDPWLAEAYGYLWPLADGGLLTAYNPSFETRTLHVDGAALAGVEAAGAVELFPFPGGAPGVVRDGAVALELKPFEVRVVRLGAAVDLTSTRPETRPSRWLELGPQVEREPTDAGVRWTVRGAVELGDVRRGDSVVLVARLQRDGQWYYHPEPHAAMQLAAVVRGSTVQYDVLPTARSANGPGFPWTLFRMPAGRSWAEQELKLRLRADLDADVSLDVQAVLFEPWWLGRRPRFSAHPAAVEAVGG